MVPRGVASNVERKDIAKRNANYPTPVESAKKKVTWQPTANCQTNVISAAKKVIWPPIAKSQTCVVSVVKKAIKQVIALEPRPMKLLRRTGLNMKSTFLQS